MNFYEDTMYNLLNEDIEAVKKYYPNIDDDVFMQLIALDPTYRGKDSLGKYGKWILNLFNKGVIAEKDFDDVTKILNQFTTYRNRIQNKDLNAYKTLNDLSDTLEQVVDDDSMLSDRQKLRFKKNIKAGRVKIDAEDDYDVVFEDSRYIVYVPNTHEASMKLGKGTEWCTAHENRDWYDKYTEDGGKLYIFKDKDSGYRYQYSDSTKDFLNELNNEFDIKEELISSDKELAKFIYKLMSIDLNDDTLVYTGGTLDSSVIDKNTIKKVIISSNVSVIGMETFYGFTNLTSVEIPDSVKQIKDSAFLSCTSLRSITLPHSIKSIGDYAFAGCTNLVSIDMSNTSMTETGDELFLNCYSLTDIKFPKELKKIGFGLFNHCRGLTNLTLPNSVKYIHNYAFQDCSSLSKLVIPNNNASMHEYVFGKDRYDSKTDTEYTVNESTQKLTIYTDSSPILEYAKALGIKTQPLSKTESLKLRISESPVYNLLNEDIEAVKKYYPKIDDFAFMTLIQLDPTYREGSDSLGKYGKWILNLYNKGSISEGDFGEITPLLNQFTKYRNRIQNKDSNSYKTLDDLESVVSAVVDDDSMLSDRQKLRFKKNVKAGRISTSAEDDYDVVFEDNQYVVYVPNTHEASMKLGKGTKWCTAHENRDWYDDYTQDGGKLYIIKNKQTGDRWQYSDSTQDFLDQNDSQFDVVSLLYSDSKLKDFFIKNVLPVSEDGIFVIRNEDDADNIPWLVSKVVIDTGDCEVRLDGNTSVQSVIMKDGVKKISMGAFSGCTRLKSVTIPNTVNFIGHHAFEKCVSLRDIIIPDSVTNIRAGAFSGCANMEHIKLPKQIKQICSSTFAFCDSLKTVDLPQSDLSVTGGNVFENCSGLRNIKIPEGITKIGNEFFVHCSNLESIIIPKSVIEIGDDAFYDCPNLTVYSDSEYVKDYCEENKIPYEPISKAKTESLKLRISEDTACVASKTSYIDEDGLDKNGIYYFGNKPKLPINWKKYKKDDNRTFKLKESENNHYFYVMAWTGDKLASSPIRRKRFDIYDNAVEYFNDAVHNFSPDVYVEMFEYIAGKRIMIANSEDGLL